MTGASCGLGIVCEFLDANRGPRLRHTPLLASTVSDRNQTAEALQIFAAIVEMDDAVRSAELEARCGADEELRRRVESLLAHDTPEDDVELDSRRGDLVRIIAEQEPHDAASGSCPERIGPFRIVRRLGHGGMGTVFEAEQSNPKRRVAVKVMQPSSAKKFLTRFRTEIELLARLQHPGIAQIFEAGQDDLGHGIQPYFAMELVDGIDLQAWAEGGRSTREQLELFAKICRAVQHAHDNGVIHRDLKPDNILITATGDFKILDFGVARAVDADSQPVTALTGVGQLVGTLPYMSPEQASGDGGDLDVRSDVYTLGVLLFQMLTGRLPYELGDRSIAAAVRVIQFSEPSSPSSTNAALRGDLDTIVRCALEKEPARRYASAAEFAADVQRFLDDEPIHARPQSLIYRVRKFSRRNRGVVVGAAVALVAISAATALMIWDRIEREREAARSAYALAISRASSSLDSNGPAVAWRTLQDAPDHLRGWEWHYLATRALDCEWTCELPGLPAGHGVVRFSGDGDAILAVESKRRLVELDARTGSRLREFELPESVDVSFFDVNRDGFAAIADARSVHLVDLASRRVLHSHVFDGVVRAVEWDPAGAAVAIGVDDGEGHAVFVVEGGRRTRVSVRSGACRELTWCERGRLLVVRSEDEVGTIDVYDRADGWATKSPGEEPGLDVRHMASAENMARIFGVDAQDEVRSWVYSPDRIGAGDTSTVIGREPVLDLECDTRGVQWVALSPDGTLSVRDRVAASETDHWVPFAVEGAECLISPGNRFVCVAGRGALAVWRMGARVDSETIAAGESPDVSTSVASPDAFRVLHRRGMVEIERRGDVVATLESSIDPVASAWSADGERLATSRSDGSVVAWNTDRFEPLLVLGPLESKPVALAWSTDNAVLVATCEDGSSRLWRSRPRSERHASRPARVERRGPLLDIGTKSDATPTADSTFLSLDVGVTPPRLVRVRVRAGEASEVTPIGELEFAPEGVASLAVESGRLFVASGSTVREVSPENASTIREFEVAATAESRCAIVGLSSHGRRLIAVVQKQDAGGTAVGTIDMAGAFQLSARLPDGAVASGVTADSSGARFVMCQRGGAARELARDDAHGAFHSVAHPSEGEYASLTSLRGGRLFALDGGAGRIVEFDATGRELARHDIATAHRLVGIEAGDLLPQTPPTLLSTSERRLVRVDLADGTVSDYGDPISSGQAASLTTMGARTFVLCKRSRRTWIEEFDAEGVAQRTTELTSSDLSMYRVSMLTHWRRQLFVTASSWSNLNSDLVGVLTFDGQIGARHRNESWHEIDAIARDAAGAVWILDTHVPTRTSSSVRLLREHDCPEVSVLEGTGYAGMTFAAGARLFALDAAGHRVVEIDWRGGVPAVYDYDDARSLAGLAAVP